MQRKVYQWVERFRSGRHSITDEGHLGHLTILWVVDSVEWVDAMVQEDRQISVTDIANKLDVSCGSAYSVIHKDLKYRKICATWVPKQFTNQHKWAHVEMCMLFFFCNDIMKKEGLSYNELSQLIIWVHHCEPVNKCQSMEWRTKKFWSVSSVGMVMLKLLWDFNGPILEYYKNHGQMVNNPWYCAMLEEGFKPAICNTEECWLMELFCITIMFNFIWQHWLLKWFKNWNWASLPTQHTFRSCHIWLPYFGLLRGALHGYQFVNY